MNIIEAIRSGKRFRKKGTYIYTGMTPEAGIYLTYEGIMADDWEVEEETFEVTEAQLNRAFHHYCKDRESGFYPIVQNLKSGGYK
jgi:hypothetical protein